MEVRKLPERLDHLREAFAVELMADEHGDLCAGGQPELLPHVSSLLRIGLVPADVHSVADHSGGRAHPG
ncbi:hypothetical protein [Nesterenkonia pannonica]|uniref:hypothetical protein n=1 Tax=Nesterenkonia pannonica TaxID=1548602 RepID=UPI002164D34C|nr:hypothetical protein [Nesterenkonia pannonica]